VKVAIIGCGRIGQVHASYVRRQPDIGALAVCDFESSAAERLAGACGATASYDDPFRMLAEQAPTIVHVCTPPATHGDLVVAALHAGAHVLAEKPMALTTDDSARIREAERAAIGTLCVDHNFLFEPAMLQARAWVQEGRIGRVLAADMFYGVDNVSAVSAARGWAGDLPCGRFTDLLPHALYLVTHFLGEAGALEVLRGTPAADGEPSELRVILDCARGLGGIHVSLAAAPWELGLMIRGTSGIIRVDLAQQRAVLARQHGGPRQIAQLRTGVEVAAQTMVGTAGRFIGKATGRLGGYPGLRILMARFYDAVRRGLPPPVGYREGAHVTALLDGIRTRLDRRIAEPDRETAAPLARAEYGT
jgi:predicted dehydrogenase